VKAWVAYAIVAFVWGSTFFAIALGIECFTPFGMVACRYLAAGCAALILGRILGESVPSRRDLPHLVVMGVLLLTGSNVLITWAEGTVSSSVTAILCSLAPVAYACLGRENLGPRTWMGLALGLLGVVVLMKPGAGGVRLGGALAILLAVVLWSYGTLYGRRRLKGQELLGQAGVQMLAGGVGCALVVPFTGGILHHVLTLKAFLAVAYLAVFGSLVGYSAFFYLSRVWSPTKMSTYVYINPIVAVVLGCVFLHEPFSLRMVLGMVVILGGVALLQTDRFASEEACETS
jgi:drug/metabolite transporter (DMT)-like permease